MNQNDSTQFFCDTCKKVKTIKITKGQNSPVVQSGLRVQTVLHRCKDGLLKVVNLHIDDKCNTRSYEELKLPEIKKPKKQIISNLPTPNLSSGTKNKWKTLQITHIPPYGGFKLILEDSVLKVKLKIGNINEENEEPLFIQNSNLNTVRFRYYTGSISPNEHTKNWFEGFINVIERLPPSNLGELIESLRYIQKLCTEPMSNKDLEIIKMIISAEDITFELKNEFEPDVLMGGKGLPDYNASTIKKLIELVTYIQYHPDHTLQDFTVSHMDDITYLIQLFNLMEEKGFIRINKPDLILV